MCSSDLVALGNSGASSLPYHKDSRAVGYFRDFKIKPIRDIGFGEVKFAVIAERRRLVLFILNRQIAGDLITEAHGLRAKVASAFVF